MPAPLGLNAGEVAKITKKLQEDNRSFTDIEGLYNGILWGYPFYINDGAQIDFVFEANTGVDLIRFATDFGDCLDDSGLVALLAAND